MDQEDGHGHHAITRAAVHELFTSTKADGSLRVDANGLIDGMKEHDYFRALDSAQEYQDRWYGPTTHPAWADGAAQRQHAMADPNLSGAQNLAVDRAYIEHHLASARHGNEMTHLGAAVHALEDSYSEAHAWRGPAANHGDPTAPIQSFNVFDPLPNLHMHTWGVLGTEGTHDGRFDHVPVGEHGELIRGSDIAAAHAVAQALGAFHDHQHANNAEAQAAVHAKIGGFFKPADSGVKVNDVFTDSWAHERDQRLEYHHNEVIQYDHAHGTDHFSKIPILEDIPVIGPLIHGVLGHQPHAAYDPSHANASHALAYDPSQPGYDPSHANADHAVAHDPGHANAGHAVAYDPSQAGYDPSHANAGHALAYDPGHANAGHDAAHDNAHAQAAAHGAEIAGHASGNEIA